MEAYCTIRHTVVPAEWILDTAFYDRGLCQSKRGWWIQDGYWIRVVYWGSKGDTIAVSSDDDMQGILHRITPVEIEQDRGMRDYSQWRPTVPDEVEQWMKSSIPVAPLHLSSLEEYHLPLSKTT